MLFVCEFCEGKICSSYKYWKRHILALRHQKNIELESLSWSQPENYSDDEVSFVITLSAQANKTRNSTVRKTQKISPENVLNYFCKFGIVSNFYFDPLGQFYILQFEEEFIESFQGEWKSHKIEEISVDISTKSEFTEDSWNTLLGINNNKNKNKSNGNFDLSKIIIKVDLNEPNKREVVLSTNSISKEQKHLDYSELFKSNAEINPDAKNKLKNSFAKLSLKKQLTIFEKSVTLSTSDEEIRKNLLVNLECILKKHFPLCKIHPFGSFFTGLSSCESDIDIFMEMQQEPDENNNKLWHAEELVDLVKKILRKSKIDNSKSRFCSKVIGINARIPIVRFLTTSGINGDISFENLLSVHNSKLIKFYITFDFRVKGLILLLKNWAQRRNLIGSHKIKSYGLVLIILTFLMKKRVIPTVQELQQDVKGTKNKIEIDGWEASFCENFAWKNTTRNSESISELSLGFFKTFSQVELENVVICPLLGIFMSRDDFVEGKESKLPRAFERYKNWVEDNGNFLDISAPICIQDPFDLAFNVCGISTENVVHLFQSECTFSYKKLKNNTYGVEGFDCSCSLYDIVTS